MFKPRNSYFGFAGKLACLLFSALRTQAEQTGISEKCQNATLRCLPRHRKSPFAIYNWFRNSRSALLTSLARSC